ncbi:unnamed protein product [Paramecium primaurelia]|uniref:Uncharacterized protein n=1 Tax=Paramecium primaurelia TaxID=5886 RepID=A0A8S1NI94_PARPR|nr:unnamed protein product [Paramecium primaurelia]CAD8091162.1 unnamed protein product [Paramecium primaurelia]
MIIPYTLTFFIIFLTYFLLRKQKKIKLDSNMTILITGGCMGIGKQMCKLLAMKQCKIIILDIRKDLIADLKNTIEQYGGKVSFYECDLSKQEQIIETINQINEPIHILINNAGVAKLKLFSEQSFQDLQLTHAVNYLAPVLLTKLLIPKMEAQKFGHIVNIGSVLSIITGLKVAAYCASKHALLGFHNSLRVELKLKKSPVKCTFIAPWAINTGMFKGVKSKIDFLLPELKEERVAIEIIDAIENQKDVHSIPSFYWLLSNLVRFLPHPIADFIVIKAQGPYISEMVGRNQ